MEIYRGSEKLAPAVRGCVLTIGKFDGLHLGHRALLRAMIARARALGRPAAVYTFDRHPAAVLAPARTLPQLMTRAQLEQGLAECGVDVLIVEPFTKALAALSPDAFVASVLEGRIAPREIFVGRDFRFGQDRQGTEETLRALAAASGVSVEVIPQVLAAGADVSSTRIRALLATGDVEEVTACLGRPYVVWGRVVRGAQRGRQLGYPTANLALENELAPATGVYATRVRRLGRDGVPADPVLASVTNVGTRPTFAGQDVTVETYLLDFDGDLYDQRLEVAFTHRLRDERRFPGPDALRAQIAADVEQARARAIPA